MQCTNEGTEMETPIQIDFRGMDIAPEIEEMLSRHLKALENRFGRITSGRLVLTGRASTTGLAASMMSTCN